MNEKLLDEIDDSTTSNTIVQEVDYKDKYYRSVAELENMKKRVEKEKIVAIKFANEKFARELLETLDNFENCLKLDMDITMRNGIELIYKGLQKTLKNHNVVECNYDNFDPHFHEGVSYIEAGLESNKVVDILRKGYIIEDRLLRPAMVTVSK